MEKRQKIRGLALGLLCAAFALSGCERSEEEPLALLTLDKERIVFDNPAEGETAQAVLRIEADRRWSVGFIGNGHDCRVSVLSGEAAAPAERFGLHLASHAKGWLPASIESSSWLRSNARRTDDLWRKIPGAAETRWFGHDRGRYMDISELAAAIDGSGVRFDYLLFDACFMSSVEALYDLRRAADYIVASPCEVMAHGFPYDTVIPSLFADDGARYDLAAACRNVYEYYNAVDSYKSGCATLTVCDELEGLATALHDINAGATKAVDATTLQSYDGMETHQFYDLEEYALALTADDARGQAFVQQMERCFPPEGRFHTAQFFSVYNNRMNDIRYYSGVTTYAPAETYRNEWQQTAWYAATKR